MADKGYANHFIDLADVRVIFHALAQGEQNFSHKEYKGTPPQACPEQGRRGKSGAVSRVLSVTVKGEKVYIELTSGPGKLTPTGAVMPDGKPEVAVNVAFTLYEARRLGATVLAYIRAWDVMRMLANKQAVSPPLTYLMVPTAADGERAAARRPASNGRRQRQRPSADPAWPNAADAGYRTRQTRCRPGDDRA
jgi:hypothetical protein